MTIASASPKTSAVMRYTTPVKAKAIDARAGDRLPVALAQHVVLVALAEAKTVMRRRREEQDQRDGRRDERRVVDIALRVVQVAELTGEPDGEQEAEEHLRAGNERPELLEQLAVLSLQLLLARLSAFHGSASLQSGQRAAPARRQREMLVDQAVGEQLDCVVPGRRTFSVTQEVREL